MAGIQLMRTALRQRVGETTVALVVSLAVMVLLVSCNGATSVVGVHRTAGSAGQSSTRSAGMGPGMMGQGGAPRMMGRGQGVPPPTVTIAPTATPGGAASISFGKDILPILTSQCGSCHGGQGGLWLTTYEQVMVGGQSGAVVVPGKPDQSLLYQRITGEKQPQMPLDAAPLTQSQIAAIRGWIAEGAPKN